MTIAINARLDPEEAGGVQTNIVGLVKTLIDLQPPFDIALLSSSIVSEKWGAMVGNRMTVEEWKFPLGWYRVPVAGDRLGLLTYAKNRLDHFRRSSARQNDAVLKTRGIRAVHFPYQPRFETDLPFIYEPWDLQHEHYPEFFSRGELAWRRRNYFLGCKRAALVVTATAWTKRDLIERYRLPPEKIAVIRRGSVKSGQRIGEAKARRILKAYNLPDKFALYPAMTFPHKNHLRLFDAMAQLRDAHGVRLNLVCSSRRHRQNHWNRIEEALKRLKLQDQVHFIGVVTADELNALYSTAKFLLFPSLFEGLGLPILEAMHCGVPVLAARSACVPEIIGDAGILFNGEDPENIAATVRDFLARPGLPGEFRRRGKQQVKKFDWNDAGAKFIACYKRVLGQELSEEEAMLFRNITEDN